MTRWNVKASTLFILSCLIFGMLVIVVLPDDVDLPDTAFHQGTAPLVVHARGTTALAAVIIAVPFHVPDPGQISGPLWEHHGFANHLDPNFRPILFRSIRR
jgi:hypothetical protein